MKDLNEYIYVNGKKSNFQRKEFTKSNTANRMGIANMPTDEQWESIDALVANVLQPVRDAKGRLRITSGYRSVELCIAVGSNKNSNHARAQAADIEPVSGDVSLFEVLEWIHDNCEFRELIAEFFPDGWIHVAFREGANDRQIKLKDANHNYFRCDLEYIRALYA